MLWAEEHVSLQKKNQSPLAQSPRWVKAFIISNTSQHTRNLSKALPLNTHLLSMRAAQCMREHFAPTAQESVCQKIPSYHPLWHFQQFLLGFLHSSRITLNADHVAVLTIWWDSHRHTCLILDPWDWKIYPTNKTAEHMQAISSQTATLQELLQ